VGGVPEVVDDGEAAVLVDPEDAVALADAILALADDEALRRTLAARAAGLAGRFDSGHAIRRIDAVYDEVSR
jgi:glycosyltransferase involved in cell wall biosynthesis